MGKRHGIGVGKRFRILTRDRFACQYCGRSAPHVPLRIDHVIPVAEGGSNDDFNLVTACEECNQGKSANELENLRTRQWVYDVLTDEERRKYADRFLVKYWLDLLAEEQLHPLVTKALRIQHWGREWDELVESGASDNELLARMGHGG